MKALLYLSFLDEALRPGYQKKIHSQCRAFSRILGTSFLLIMNGAGFVLYRFENGEEVVVKNYDNPRKRISKKRNAWDEWFGFSQFDKIARESIDTLDIDYVYLRRIVPITYRLIQLLRYVKSKEKKLIYEYPSFPWKEEMRSFCTSFSRRLFYALDLCLYPILIRYPDIVTYMGSYHGKDNRFFELVNAGDAQDFKIKTARTPSDDSVTLLIVGHLRYEHGCDIILDAMKRYYQACPNRRVVYFRIVGDGDVIDSLKEQVAEYSLKKYVTFTGFLDGEDLDREFENADIGINPLRSDSKNGAVTLKALEYTYRGIMQIGVNGYRMLDDAVDKGQPSFLYVMRKNDISIEKILEFYDREHNSFSPQNIRNYAIMHMSWDGMFKKLLMRL